MKTSAQTNARSKRMKLTASGTTSTARPVAKDVPLAGLRRKVLVEKELLDTEFVDAEFLDTEFLDTEFLDPVLPGKALLVTQQTMRRK